MKVIATLFVLICVECAVNASFIPLTIRERVKAADIIAVITVDDYGSHLNSVGCTVSVSVYGTKKNEKLTLATDSNIAGRDPYLQKGSAYLVFLKRDSRGRLVTVQSSLDAFAIKNGIVSHWQVDVKAGRYLEPKLSDLLPELRQLVGEIKQGKNAKPDA